jgi:redox-sensitive bicupin YhaK (pirin superfamily)
MNRIPNPAQPHASLATTGSAQTLAQLTYVFHAQTDNILIQAVGGNVRMTLNGNAPTTALGILIADGASILLDNQEARNARFITASGTPRLEIVAYLP